MGTFLLVGDWSIIDICSVLGDSLSSSTQDEGPLKFTCCLERDAAMDDSHSLMSFDSESGIFTLLSACSIWLDSRFLGTFIWRIGLRFY